jgi:hypothetical protein
VSVLVVVVAWRTSWPRVSTDSEERGSALYRHAVAAAVDAATAARAGRLPGTTAVDHADLPARLRRHPPAPAQADR